MMTRDDVIDVLTAVAAGDRRTVGHADVEFWQAVMGDLPKTLALQAVRNHFRERPGVWLEPGHVVAGVRALRRDQLDRESDEERDTRLAAQAARLTGEPLAITVASAERVSLQEWECRHGKRFPRFALPKAPSEYEEILNDSGVKALRVPCPYCGAAKGSPCVVAGSKQLLRRVIAHPSRVEAAAAAEEAA